MKDGVLVPQTTKRPLEMIEMEVGSLDIDHICDRVMNERRWAPAKVQEVKNRYLRFLILSVTVEEVIIPSKDIDAIWHEHILDTEVYERDCMGCFGFILHHHPGYGTKDQAEAQKLREQYERTCAIYAEHYGEPYEFVDASARSSRVSVPFSGPPDCG